MKKGQGETGESTTLVKTEGVDLYMKTKAYECPGKPSQKPLKHPKTLEMYPYNGTYGGNGRTHDVRPDVRGV